MDRERLESEAVRLLGKGRTDEALEKYVAILRAHPRERRIRQKVAELYMNMGDARQAEKHYREVAKQMTKSGQQRAAINIFKQLVKIKPDDTELRGELGDCLMEEGFENDAIQCYRECMEKLGRIAPDQAIEFCDRLIKLKPGEFTLRIQRAEYIEKANWSEAAAAEWHVLAGESRRLGRPDEATRFLEFSLRQRGENPAVLVQAAEGQLEQGDVKRALQHLQAAHKLGGAKGQVFGLLGACFHALGQGEKSQKLWLQAAKAYGDEGNESERSKALKEAIGCGATDSETRQAYDEAHQAAARVALRLHTQDWAQAKSDVEGIPSVKADTYWTYGFGERALALLTELPEPARSSVPVRVRVAELRADQGDLGGALQEIRQIKPPDEGASEHIWTRISVLSGDDDDDELIDDEEEELIDEDEDEDGILDADDDLVDEDDDDLIDDEDEDDVMDQEEDLVEDADEEEMTDPGSTLSSSPSVSKVEDPLDFGSDFGEKTFGAGGSGFGNIFGEDEEDAGVAVGTGQVMGSEGLADARAWLAIGEYAKTLESLDGKLGLEADVWRAVVGRLMGNAKDAFSELRDAVDESPDGDDFFTEAQLELARLAAICGKTRTAERTLKQLSSEHPGFRSRDVAAIKHALKLLREG